MRDLPRYKSLNKEEVKKKGPLPIVEGILFGYALIIAAIAIGVLCYGTYRYVTQ